MSAAADTPPRTSEDLEPAEHESGWMEALRIGCVALAAVAVWLRLWEPLDRVSLIGIAVLRWEASRSFAKPSRICSRGA